MPKIFHRALVLIMVILLSWSAALADKQKSVPDMFRLRMPEERARSLAHEFGGADALLFPWAGGEWRGRFSFEQGRLTALTMTAQKSVSLADLLNHMALQGYAPLLAESGRDTVWLHEPAARGAGTQERATMTLAANPVRVLFVSRDLLAVFTHAAKIGGDVQSVRVGNLRARVFEWRAGPPESVLLTTLEHIAE